MHAFEGKLYNCSIIRAITDDLLKYFSCVFCLVFFEIFVRFYIKLKLSEVILGK